MRLTKRHQWMLFAGAAGALAAPIAEKAVTAAWRQAMGEDPPDDSSQESNDWGKAIAWTVASAVVVGLAQVAAKRAAAAAWEGFRGEAPPKRRPKRRRRALA
jgi:hypothetical protein